MSNDYDSYLSCRFLRWKFGIPIGGYFDFEKGLYLTNESMSMERKFVFVDVACSQNGVYCFDNHAYNIANNQCANPNALLSYCDRETYNQKYNGSTLLLLYALYGDKSSINYTEKMTLLTIDKFYIGLFKDGGKWKSINLCWLEQLDMLDVLQSTINSSSEDDYIDFEQSQRYANVFKIGDSDFRIREYELSKSNRILSNRLTNDSTLYFPIKVISVEQKRFSKEDFLRELMAGRVFSAAQTWKNRYSTSVITDDISYRRLQDEQNQKTA